MCFSDAMSWAFRSFSFTIVPSWLKNIALSVTTHIADITEQACHTPSLSCLQEILNYAFSIVV